MATVFGIPVRVHLTFFILLVWWAGYSAKLGDSAILSVAYLLMVFGCVVLHELGHALAARLFQVRTREIVLYPMGGVARLENVPQGLAEFVIALAGPLVNLVLGIVLLVVALAIDADWATLGTGSTTALQLLLRLCLTNFVLFAFNLLPAFPMDGGRVLRALLSMVIGPLRATMIAAFVGRLFAVLLGVLGVFVPNGLLLVMIAVFVFFGASQELAFQRRREVWRGHRVRDAMVTRLDTLSPADSLRTAARNLLDTRQQDFPVLDAWGRVAGVLTRATLLDGLAKLGDDSPVLDVMERDVAQVGPDMMLDELLEVMGKRPDCPVVVVEDERVVGLITFQELARFFEVARRVSGGAPAPDTAP